MPFDQAPPIQTAQAPDWELPEVLGIEIRATPYRPGPCATFSTRSRHCRIHWRL